VSGSVPGTFWCRCFIAHATRTSKFPIARQISTGRYHLLSPSPPPLFLSLSLSLTSSRKIHLQLYTHPATNRDKWRKRFSYIKFIKHTHTHTHTHRLIDESRLLFTELARRPLRLLSLIYSKLSTRARNRERERVNEAGDL